MSGAAPAPPSAAVELEADRLIANRELRGGNAGGQLSGPRNGANPEGAEPGERLLRHFESIASQFAAAEREMAAMRLIGADDSPTAGLLEEELRAAGIEPDWVFRSGRDRVVRAMVAAGMGAALVSRSAVEEGEERTVPLAL